MLIFSRSHFYSKFHSIMCVWTRSYIKMICMHWIKVFFWFHSRKGRSMWFQRNGKKIIYKKPKKKINNCLFKARWGEYFCCYWINHMLLFFRDNFNRDFILFKLWCSFSTNKLINVIKHKIYSSLLFCF